MVWFINLLREILINDFAFSDGYFYFKVEDPSDDIYRVYSIPCGEINSILDVEGSIDFLKVIENKNPDFVDRMENKKVRCKFFDDSSELRLIRYYFKGELILSKPYINYFNME